MVPFVCLASVCWSLQCVISALTQAGGGGLLFGLLVPSRCGVGLALLSPSAAQAPGCSIWSVPCAARGSSPRDPQKPATKSCDWFFCLPCPSGSGSQGLDGRTLPGCGVPSRLRVPSLGPHPLRQGACALCLAATLPADVAHPESQEVFDLKLEACLQCGRGCGPWGRACPFPLPPASGGAGPVRSPPALLWTCSVPLFCEQPAVCLAG